MSVHPPGREPPRRAHRASERDHPDQREGSRHFRRRTLGPQTAYVHAPDPVDPAEAAHAAAIAAGQAQAFEALLLPGLRALGFTPPEDPQ